jgi:divalent metal cation (Fe/Co/Zn/Cd) transporter
MNNSTNSDEEGFSFWLMFLGGAIFAAGEVICSSVIARLVGTSLPPAVSAVCASILTIAGVGFLTSAVLQRWKSSESPVLRNPRVQRYIFLASGMSYIIFLVVQAMLFKEHGSVDIFQHL